MGTPSGVQSFAVNWIPQWPKVGRVLSNTTFFTLAVLILGGVIVLDVGISVITSRTNGETRGYNAGLVAGRADACRALAVQVRWTFNVEDQLIASGKDSPVVGEKAKAVAGGAYEYTCVASGARTANLYFPGGTAPALSLGTATLPISNVKTGCPACLLRGQPSPTPKPEN